MRRAIVGFQQDDAGEWAARLSCLHGQHIRHRPPFQLAPWVLDDAERTARIGSPLECPLCDRAELPNDLEVVDAVDSWDGSLLPPGTWGLIHVEEGEVRFLASTQPPIDASVTPGHAHPIPPEVEHRVEPVGQARFTVELLRRPVF